MKESGHIKYLMANEQDMAWGLVATTVGHQLIEPGVQYPASNHPVRYLFSTEKGRVLNEYQLIYISKGSGTFVSSHRKETTITEGDMLLLFPGEWHNYSPSPDTGWHESWIGFTGPNMDKRVEAGFFDRDKPVFSPGVDEQVIEMYRTAAAVARDQGTGYQQLLAGTVNMLLGFAYAEGRRMIFRDMDVENQITRAKLFIHNNFVRELPCEEIADHVGMGYSRFRRIFREYTGFAPAQYVQELRISRAKELLTNTDMPSQEIAYESGFVAPSYFNIVFRKKTGMTPTEYRIFTQGKRL